MAGMKLNNLQRRTLALLQQLARHEEVAEIDAETGDATILQLPHPHGDHVHIGELVVPSRFASGLANANVWQALARKGLVADAYPYQLVVTAKGLAFDTGIETAMTAEADH